MTDEQDGTTTEDDAPPTAPDEPQTAEPDNFGDEGAGQDDDGEETAPA